VKRGGGLADNTPQHTREPLCTRTTCILLPTINLKIESRASRGTILGLSDVCESSGLPKKFTISPLGAPPGTGKEHGK